MSFVNVVVFLLVTLIYVAGATALLRAIIAAIARLIDGSRHDRLFHLIVAHIISLFLVGFLSTAGAGISDFPTIGSVLTWSIIFAGPAQAIAFTIDLGFYVWRKSSRQTKMS